MPIDKVSGKKKFHLFERKMICIEQISTLLTRIEFDLNQINLVIFVFFSENFPSNLYIFKKIKLFVAIHESNCSDYKCNSFRFKM